MEGDGEEVVIGLVEELEGVDEVIGLADELEGVDEVTTIFCALLIVAVAHTVVVDAGAFTVVVDAAALTVSVTVTYTVTTPAEDAAATACLVAGRTVSVYR